MASTVSEVLHVLLHAAPGATDLSVDMCQLALDTPAFANDDAPCVAPVDADVLTDTVQRLKELLLLPHGADAVRVDDAALAAKQAAAVALATLNHATDADAVAAAARLLLALCRLPVGVASTNVLSSVAAALGRVAVDAAKSIAKGRRPAKDTTTGGTAEAEVVGPEGTRRSQRTATARSASSSATTDGHAEVEEEDEENDVDLALTQPAADPFAGPLPASQEALLAATNVQVTGRQPLAYPVSGSVLWALVKDVGHEGVLRLYAHRAGCV